MSKKKATMTLKDFHGGSIPSDLPLPSSPGVIVRPSSDRGGFDRQTTPWANPMGRSDHCLRPGSAGASRNFDDKTPFLGHNPHIGRHFDEDERKPLDGGSAPRRTVSDDSIRGLPIRAAAAAEPTKLDPHPLARPVSGGGSSYAARFTEAAHVGINSSQSFGRSYSGSGGRLSHQTVGANSGQQAAAGLHLNAWGLRKEGVGVAEPASTMWSAPDAATKLAHASALEKVSSGRWHSKQPIHQQIDVEVIRHTETESEVHSKDVGIHDKNTYNVHAGRELHDVTMARHVGRSLTVDDSIRTGGKELPAYERARSPIYSEMKERNPPSYVDGVSSGKFGGSELQSPRPSESGRRLFNLLPRSKPLENVEPPVMHKQQGHQQPTDTVLVENGGETYSNANSMNHGAAGSEAGNRASERPKLSLKPRSQPIEQVEGNIEKESHKSTLFGGARPRELVLKDRGIDDVTTHNYDVGQSPNRVKQDVPRPETLHVHGTPTRQSEKAENVRLDNRNGKNIDRRDHRVDVEKTDVQRRSWRNENRRSSKDLENQQQLPQERAPSPETWRKPIEQPTSLETPGPRYRKASSAVELAQAFSRSISDPKAADRFSSQRGIPSRGQILFSRLTGPHPRPQINGY